MNNELRYIYESHLGGLYWTSDKQEDTYCETCGDSDTFIGTATTKKEARKTIMSSGEYWSKDGVNQWLKEAW